MNLKCGGSRKFNLVNGGFLHWNAEENASNDNDNASIPFFFFPFQQMMQMNTDSTQRLKSVPLFILEDKNGFKRQGMLWIGEWARMGWLRWDEMSWL